jgi:hypothetical protein
VTAGRPGRVVSLLRRVALALAVLALPAGAAAVPAPPPAAGGGPEPGSELTVYLVTMGPGAEVWERFGHNAIWIRDAARGTDVAYNYGLFDLGQEKFLVRFLRGQMLYWMAGAPSDRMVREYARDDRSVWVQELELLPAQRRTLRDFLQWNARPEHRFYRYDYYRDNCSTRVRDALDRVLAGRIRQHSEGRPAGVTYRFHTSRLTANDPAVYTGLLLALGEGVDRPISAWEEMFLPMRLRDHLRGVTVPGPGGQSVPLVRAEQTLYLSTKPQPPPAPPHWTAAYLSVGVLIGLSAASFAVAVPRRRLARRGLVVVAGGWTLLAGLAGVVLAGLWGLTDHAMAGRNENLFQVNPIALVLAALIGPLSTGADWARRPALRLAAAAAICSLLGLLAKPLPGFDQINGAIIALALPAHLGTWAAVWLVARGDPTYSGKRIPSTAASTSSLGATVRA